MIVILNKIMEKVKYISYNKDANSEEYALEKD